MKRKIYSSFLTVIILLSIGFVSCLDPAFEERTNYQELIGEFLENNPDEFSMLVELLEKSESMSFLKAYGALTLLAPTNSAFEKFFAESEFSSLSDMDREELRNIVRYHVITDTIPSTEFVDGRMNTTNMFGHYITTGTFFRDNQAVLMFNKYAEVRQRDIRMANGIIHSINDVIRPELQTAAQVIEADSRFTIFTEALKRTSWFDTLHIGKGPHTVFAIPDAVYKAEGFDSFDDLWADVDPDEGNLLDINNPMNMYVAYHILDKNLRYVSDLVFDRVGLTRVRNEVVTIRPVGVNVLVNDDVFAGVHEPGFEINRDESDRTVLNGVLHVMKEDFRIKERHPFAVYWSVTEQLEIMRMPGVFRRPGDAVVLQPGDLENITWTGGNIFYEGRGGGAANPWVVHGDLFNIMLRPEVIPWVELKTPVLAAGDYKIWICFRGSSAERHPVFFVHFNDIPLPNVIRTSPYNPTNRTERPGYSERELESRGYKFYQWNPDDIAYTRSDDNDPDITRNILESNYIADSRVFGMLAGTITVPTTGSHALRFVGISGTKEFWLDMVHFIPVDEDQLWPRVNTKNGRLVTKEEIHAAYEVYQSQN
ncbi:fasciclin domain-containing protein [Alkalitalea saponilacus]|uniref:Uncaracterized surface protein containing fasciclin (FAS1) repeats n=1 Tax=Alkalitalea saponilacus TaxID=889453 RepID=A0A1T5EUL2_9BACT|nr:fasciclin domain-containing protein [Alkalitalea saponilacus]ASB48023.1 hypothetical protein CDL62_02115 [Alkalitalea saponilacus]SKB87662.1 Uncaracterized surface protein containing fasciclin (FAS1) repeats [Alkalitalea saponilacus]